MTVHFFNVPLVFLALLSACTPLPAEKKPAQSTAAPPVATEVLNSSPNLITLKFDKEISADPANFMIVPEIGIPKDVEFFFESWTVPFIKYSSPAFRAWAG